MGHEGPVLGPPSTSGTRRGRSQGSRKIHGGTSRGADPVLSARGRRAGSRVHCTFSTRTRTTMLTHMPPKKWCEICCMAAPRDTRVSFEDRDRKPPLLSFDFLFFSRRLHLTTSWRCRHHQRRLQTASSMGIPVQASSRYSSWCKKMHRARLSASRYPTRRLALMAWTSLRSLSGQYDILAFV